MKHRLVVIGWLGNKTCFLDMTRAEAIKRYQEMNPPLFEGDTSSKPLPDLIDEFQFEDVFSAYDAWK